MTTKEATLLQLIGDVAEQEDKDFMELMADLIKDHLWTTGRIKECEE